jgi:hemerythrin-like domain-containing protein
MSESWQSLLMRDHETTEKVFAAMEKPFTSPAGPAPALVAKFFDYVNNYVDRCHNQKEEQHLFPLFDGRGTPPHSGPLCVMRA